MTGEVRAVIRQARDRAARELLARFAAAGELRLCAGCGVPTECRTPGCRTCFNRVRNRAPERAAALLAYRRDRRTRRRIAS